MASPHFVPFDIAPVEPRDLSQPVACRELARRVPAHRALLPRAPRPRRTHHGRTILHPFRKELLIAIRGGRWCGVLHRPAALRAM